jgi:hypothetical protein
MNSKRRAKHQKHAENQAATAISAHTAGPKHSLIIVFISYLKDEEKFSSRAANQNSPGPHQTGGPLHK